MPKPLRFDVTEMEFAIVGGGLAGLSLANHLHAAGKDVQVYEARSRLGGRVKTQNAGGAGFDLGPSWFWPGQSRMEALTHQLGLTVFDQYCSGSLSFETETGEIVRDRGYASMEGSLRIDGGMDAIISKLSAGLPGDRVHLQHEVTRVHEDGTLCFENEIRVSAGKTILAVPPRVAAELVYQPELDEKTLSEMRNIPTWMGGHAKFVAVYERPFWREAGLSGDAMSRKGPLAEIHDASADDPAKPAALFGFVGVPANGRKGADDLVIQASIDQLVRIFGQDAANSVEVFYQDWAFETFSSSALDQEPLYHHPTYGMPEALRQIWDGRLQICSTEVAPQMGGYLEGALAAAEYTFQHLMEHDPG